jgi:hypothetical protein
MGAVRQGAEVEETPMRIAICLFVAGVVGAMAVFHGAAPAATPHPAGDVVGGAPLPRP